MSLVCKVSTETSGFEQLADKNIFAVGWEHLNGSGVNIGGSYSRYNSVSGTNPTSASCIFLSATLTQTGALSVLILTFARAVKRVTAHRLKAA